MHGPALLSIRGRAGPGNHGLSGVHCGCNARCTVGGAQLCGEAYSCESSQHSRRHYIRGGGGMAHKLCVVGAVMILLVVTACTPWQLADLPLDPAPTAPALPTPVVFVGAGDIASCG